MLELTEIELFAEDLPEELEGLRLIHLSDLHTLGYGAAEQAAAEVLAEGAELAVFTGDSCFQLRIGNPFYDTKGDHDCHKVGLDKEGLTFAAKERQALMVWEELLKGARVKLGIYGIQGNHDTHDFMGAWEAMGVRVLANESVVLETEGGGRLQLCGVCCYKRTTQDIPKMLAQNDPALFTIGLCHYPDYFEALAAGGVDVVLAGHTHGGQICPSKSRPLMTHCWTGRRYARGLVRWRDAVLYTSRGVGYALVPVRINAKAEVMRMTLRRGARERTEVRAREWGKGEVRQER